MISFVVKLLTLSAIFNLCFCSTTFLDSKKQSFYVKTPKSLDYKLRGKNDDHRFGFEVEENSQFHHTKTAEDGVRIGCFSHSLNGQTYLTHYVADAKGYRLVPYDKVITVYPKDDGKPRKASFSEFFNKEELRRANIFYIFPEGCKTPSVTPSVKSSLAEIKDENVEIPAEATINEQIVENVTEEELMETTQSAEVTETTQNAEVTDTIFIAEVTELSETTQDVTETTESTETTTFSPYSDDEISCNENCCEGPRIIFPKPDSCCKTTSKLVIPINLSQLEKSSITEIAELSNESDPVKLLLKLLRLLEKCRA